MAAKTSARRNGRKVRNAPVADLEAGDGSGPSPAPPHGMFGTPAKSEAPGSRAPTNKDLKNNDPRGGATSATGFSEGRATPLRSAPRRLDRRLSLLEEMARPERFERPTLRFVVWGKWVEIQKLDCPGWKRPPAPLRL
jgi:hypothetical protein